MGRFIKDIERCPFIPKEEGYDNWMKEDQERLEKLEEKYQRILKWAKFCKHPDNGPIFSEALDFIIDMLDEK